jgi:putative SOS response-associated peptidase YedK
MSLAGIWTSWRAGTPEEQRSFSIMTITANSLMEKIHDRMPVILDPKHFDKWLDPEIHEPEQVGAMLKPCPAELMECAVVSTLVNKPANNRAEVLEPLSASS